MYIIVDAILGLMAPPQSSTTKLINVTARQPLLFAQLNHSSRKETDSQELQEVGVFLEASSAVCFSIYTPARREVVFAIPIARIRC
jgi:hypothetical protein